MTSELAYKNRKSVLVELVGPDVDCILEPSLKPASFPIQHFLEVEMIVFLVCRRSRRLLYLSR